MRSATRFLPLVTLAFVSTLMAELLSGSTPFSRIVQLLPQFFIYGSAAILVRGTARRYALGWSGIILMGFAFGFFLEGLALQSIFNPHFLGLNISFGRLAGVNWVWAEIMPGLHSFWSITGAILVTELIFFQERNDAWIGGRGLWTSSVILLLMGVAYHFLFIKISGFTAPFSVFAGCIAVVLLLVVIALKLPRNKTAANTADIWDAFPFILIFIVTLAAGIAWLSGIYAIFNSSKISLWVPLAGGLLVIFLYFTFMIRWKRIAIENNFCRLAIASGLLVADLVLGYTATTGNSIDHTGQIVILVLTIVFIIILFRRLFTSRVVTKGL